MIQLFSFEDNLMKVIYHMNYLEKLDEHIFVTTKEAYLFLSKISKILKKFILNVD